MGVETGMMIVSGVLINLGSRPASSQLAGIANTTNGVGNMLAPLHRWTADRGRLHNFLFAAAAGFGLPRPCSS
ncbi:MAG: hypothetical protein R2851_22065 [Caldilineaceae bacterium]